MMVEKIFESDDVLIKYESCWSLEQLLDKKGVFLLKDISDLLSIKSLLIKRRAEAIQDSGRSTWEVMGCRKIWNHWYVRMKVFAPYYLTNFRPSVVCLSPDWSVNEILAQEGVFALSDVSKRLNIKASSVRYLVKKSPNSKTEMGIWKVGNIYAVRMERFSVWYAKYKTRKKRGIQAKRQSWSMPDKNRLTER